jgi:hypothetical protein
MQADDFLFFGAIAFIFQVTLRLVIIAAFMSLRR